MISLAKKKLNEGDYSHAIAILENLALNHNAEAFFLLGQCYSFARGVPQYEFIANECYTMASKLGWTNFEDAWQSLPIYFLINAGDCMKNKKSELNEFMNNVVLKIQKMSGTDLWCNFKLQAMAFSDTVKWYHSSGLVEANKFNWKIPPIGGKIDYALMFNKINEKILIPSNNNYRIPLFILITNDTVSDDFKKGLMLIKQNKIFSHAVKIAICLGNEVIQSFNKLAVFTGGEELLIRSVPFSNCERFLESIINSCCRPVGIPEWPSSIITDSMDNIEEEIKYLVKYMRE